MIYFDGWHAVHFVPETIFAGLDDFTLVSLPMFIIMGAAVASSRAGSDLYEALARWLNRVPGSLVISNIGACALFSALTGSSPATCAAIGKMGIPEMRKRGYDADLATGAIAAGGTLGILIPPSITMILYGIASETSIGRLFIAGILPGLLLTGLFHGLGAVPQLEARHQAGRQRAHLLDEGKAPTAAAPAALHRRHRRRGVCALRRHRHALGGGRRRRAAVPGDGDGDLSRLQADGTMGSSCAPACANRACC
ncbi:MAG: TRAP transporter large permease subunit [Rhodocyclaceae bacterium]|nr:TRAP transporter large permease subunit [Rhodocyclaceae bacterium]